MNKCHMDTQNCVKTGKHDTCHIQKPQADKQDAGKYDPTHLSIEMIELVCRVRDFGAKKYSRNNWKNGFKITRSLAAALRHIYSFLSGEDNDTESGLSHLGHAVCSIEHAIHTMQHHKTLDDRGEQ